MEIDLYDVTLGTRVLHLTPHETVVQLDGPRYLPLPIRRNALALGAEAAKAALELDVPPDCELVRQLLAAAVTGETSMLRLRTAQPDAYGGWTFLTRWMGRVLGVEVADDSARIRGESAQVSLKRIGLRRLYSRACAHVLYSAACGATPIVASAVVSNSAGRTVDLAGGVPAAVAGMLSGGWLETASGVRHMIVSESTAGVELLYPAPLAPGDGITLTAGCDHSTATCAARFSNLDNYGGFPFIPTKNPFATGVF
ncbi:phage BR0599 family protein [Thermomonas sp. S9]|uniref:phage BR0599 family protein n=1 Tax=Thermomonas sp. S9 TaxID=2885203 RepID=UPI00216B37EE|nr:phage BR0599 family protein [Thermomonas sp. S9]MCR6497100.1 phage BR0599 family protein [Thermomonas sp. S9]MCR6497356.1 phage BR0599 family protein [Thermomonas sp. S9]